MRISDEHVDQFKHAEGLNTLCSLFDSELSGIDSWSLILFSNNLGSLMAFHSNITFYGYAKFVNNQRLPTTSGDFQEGGAIILFQSNAFLMELAILNITMLKMVEQYILLRAKFM